MSINKKDLGETLTSLDNDAENISKDEIESALSKLNEILNEKKFKIQTIKVHMMKKWLNLIVLTKIN